MLIMSQASWIFRVRINAVHTDTRLHPQTPTPPPPAPRHRMPWLTVLRRGRTDVSCCAAAHNRPVTVCAYLHKFMFRGSAGRYFRLTQRDQLRQAYLSTGCSRHFKQIFLLKQLQSVKVREEGRDASKASAVPRVACTLTLSRIFRVPHEVSELKENA